MVGFDDRLCRRHRVVSAAEASRHPCSAGILAPLLLVIAFFSARSMAQQSAPAAATRVFTLEEAVNFAWANYPAIKAAQQQITAARGGVALARTSYLPRVDALWQSNRATRNNLFGLLLPQSVISPISGPVLPTSSMG